MFDNDHSVLINSLEPPKVCSVARTVAFCFWLKTFLFIISNYNYYYYYCEWRFVEQNTFDFNPSIYKMKWYNVMFTSTVLRYSYEYYNYYCKLQPRKHRDIVRQYSGFARNSAEHDYCSFVCTLQRYTVGRKGYLIIPIDCVRDSDDGEMIIRCSPVFVGSGEITNIETCRLHVP